MKPSKESAISPTREEDYSEWYQQVVKAAELAENSSVRGCMVIKPWGYGTWERMQRELDLRIKATGHENAYFPLFIPISLLEKEATHVEGFAKECAVVTHHRLEVKDGKLVPTSPLEEPLVVRPTSETIIGESFAKWVQSYRDLPLLINQWANVVRWEMRPRVFLRTAEFLWQEGHTVHVDEQDAMDETMRILELYRAFMEEVLAMPVIPGEKPASERFPGAVRTFCVEAMMQDRKALQAGTSHYLGQNFAKASEIKFVAESGAEEYAHTTSWGVSTRMLGGLIMTHADDDGLRLPPRVAPKHVVIIPVVTKPELESQIHAYAERIAESLRGLQFHREDVCVQIDRRDLRGGEKSWQWIKKGIPLRIEVGPRDMESNSVVLLRRDKGHKEKLSLRVDELPDKIVPLLSEMQQNYLNEARAFREKHIERNLKSVDDFRAYFTPKNQAKPEIHAGFALAPWCGEEDAASAKLLSDLKVTIRCLPLEQEPVRSACILTGRAATVQAVFAKAY